MSIDKRSFSYLAFSLLGLLKEEEEEILRPYPTSEDLSSVDGGELQFYIFEIMDELK